MLWARLENQNTKSFIALRDKVGERYSISQKFLRNRKLFAFTVIAVKEASSMSAFYVFPPQVMPCKAYVIGHSVVVDSRFHRNDR